MSSLRNKTVNGVIWTVLGRGGLQAISLVLTVVLARLLSPTEFGLLAMVTVITAFADAFREMGLSAALVQKQGATEAHRSSMFWLNVAAGVFFNAVFVLAAPWIADFYDKPILYPLTLLVSLKFSITGLTVVQSTLLVKRIDFRKKTMVSLVSSSVAGALAVGMALLGFGVWSLAGQMICGAVISAVMLWTVGSWRPRLLFDWEALKELLGFGVNRMGSVLLNYWARRADTLLIGWRIGPDALGLYDKAYQLLLFPVVNVTRTLATVMFPSFSQMGADKERMRRVYLRVTGVIALLTCPLMFGLLVTAQPFVLAIFGEQWLGMVPIVKVFAIAGLLDAITKIEGTVYLSQGRADLQFRVSLLTKTLLVAGIVVGLGWGIVGVAWGYTLASALGFFPSYYFVGRMLNLSLGAYAKNLLPTLACGAFMAGAVWVAETALVPEEWVAVLRLGVLVVTGAFVYAAMVHLCSLRAYTDLKSIVRDKMRNRRDGPQRKKVPLHPTGDPGISSEAVSTTK